MTIDLVSTIEVTAGLEEDGTVFFSSEIRELDFADIEKIYLAIQEFKKQINQ